MRINPSDRQIRNRQKKEQAFKIAQKAKRQSAAATSGPVLVGENWGLREDENGNLVAHNVWTGKSVVIAPSGDDELSN